MKEKLEDYSPMHQAYIKKLGGLEEYRKVQAAKGAKGGRAKGYKWTPEQRKAHSERMKQRSSDDQSTDT